MILIELQDLEQILRIPIIHFQNSERNHYLMRDTYFLCSPSHTSQYNDQYYYQMNLYMHQRLDISKIYQSTDLISNIQNRALTSNFPCKWPLLVMCYMCFDLDLNCKRVPSIFHKHPLL